MHFTFFQVSNENQTTENPQIEIIMNVKPIAEILSFTAVECGLAFEYKDHIMLQPDPVFNKLKLPSYKLNYYVSDNSIEMVSLLYVFRYVL